MCTLVTGGALALVAAAPATADTAPPQITIVTPKTGTVYDQELRIEASATDPDGLGRITFKADGREIRNFTTNLANGKAVSLGWRRARELSPGEHTITVEAVDKAGSNPSPAATTPEPSSVTVRRVPATSLTRAPTTVTMKISGSGLRRVVSGAVSAPVVSFPRETFPLTGKVRIVWEVFSNKRWKVRHKDSSDAAAPYRFSQRLAKRGRWRVHVVYEPAGALRGVTLADDHVRRPSRAALGRALHSQLAMSVMFGERISGLTVDGKELHAAVFNENQVRAAAGLTMVIGAVAFAYAYFDQQYVPLQVAATFFFVEFLIRLDVRDPVQPGRRDRRR